MTREESKRVATTAVDVGAMAGECLDDRFRLVRRIGEGGYGAVFEAVQLSVERTCAVKVLASRLGADELSRQRFHVEAKATAELTHPNTVTLFDFGVDDTTGVLFLAMEMLDGSTLREIVTEEGLLPIRVVVSILEAAAASLQEAHDKGVVHRDVKPHNLICTDLEHLGEAGSHVPIKVIDFGIAKTVCAGGEGEPGDELPDGIAPAGGLTKTGMMVGTPTYMSPEQIRGNEVDGRVDQYALAMSAYWMATGQTPYAGSTALEVASRHLTEPPLPLTSYRPELQVPPALEDVLLKALSKDPDDRFERIKDFSKACRETLNWTAASSAEPELGPSIGEVDQAAVESSETAAIREAEARKTPAPSERPATDETERTRVVGGSGDASKSQHDSQSGSGSDVAVGRAWRDWVERLGSWRVSRRRGMIIAAVASALMAVVIWFAAPWESRERESEFASEIAESPAEAAPTAAAMAAGGEVSALLSKAVWAGRMRAFDRRLPVSDVGWLNGPSDGDRNQPDVDGTESHHQAEAPTTEESERNTASRQTEVMEPGLLAVRMIPWGVLYINGERISQGIRAQKNLKAGRHRVVMKQEGAVIRDVTVEVEPGKRRELVLEAE